MLLTTVFIRQKKDDTMNVIDRIFQYFQCFGASLSLVFSVFNLVRSLVDSTSFVVILCFVSMTVLSLILTGEVVKDIIKEEE